MPFVVSIQIIRNVMRPGIRFSANTTAGHLLMS